MNQILVSKRSTRCVIRNTIFLLSFLLLGVGIKGENGIAQPPCPPVPPGVSPPPNCVPITQPPENSSSIVGDVNNDGRVDQADVAALQSILSGEGGFLPCPECGIPDAVVIEDSDYMKRTDLARPCGIINEKDLKALIKAIRKIERGKLAPKSKCHDKRRVGTTLSVARDNYLNIQNTQLQVYNLSGKFISQIDLIEYQYTQSISSQTLKLVPGVYLAVITVRDLSGYPIRREVRRVVVLR
jgi:hypothetical protein